MPKATILRRLGRRRRPNNQAVTSTSLSGFVPQPDLRRILSRSPRLSTLRDAEPAPSRPRRLVAGQLVAFVECQRHAVGVHQQTVLGQAAGEEHTVPVLVGGLPTSAARAESSAVARALTTASSGCLPWGLARVSFACDYSPRVFVALLVPALSAREAAQQAHRSLRSHPP